jgi:predicted Zn-dependent peptidase
MQAQFFDKDGIKIAIVPSDSEVAFYAIGTLAGAKYEKKEEAGFAHFVEHMFFKGTQKYNWNELNHLFARYGIMQNAATSQEDITVHVSFPKDEFEQAISLTNEIFFNSNFPDQELETERKVILREKDMYDDDPNSIFMEKGTNHYFAWDIAHSALGTAETINSATREKLLQYLRSNISLFENVAFVFSGNIDANKALNCILNSIPFKSIYAEKKERPATISAYWNDDAFRTKRQDFRFTHEKTIQTHVASVTEGINALDPTFPALKLAVSALGSGMVSPLYTRIREELGLCYYISSNAYSIAYPDSTIFSIMSMTAPHQVDLLIEEADRICEKLVGDGIGEDLFICTKNPYLCRMMRNMESSSSMGYAILQPFLHGREMSAEEYIASYKGVTLKQCNEALEMILSRPRHWMVMNPETGAK